jgi:hypothetical protein
MSSYADKVRHGKPGALWLVGLAATAVLHGAIVASVWALRGEAKAHPLASPLAGQVVDVQAVKFGKPRDLSFLPHKQAVLATKGPRPKIALTENERALPRPPKPDDKEPDQVDDDPLKRTRAQEFKNMTDEPQAGVEDEGDPNGVRGGNATVGKGPLYYQHLMAAVRNAWTVPTTIPERELQRLQAQACFKIDASGHITEIGIRKPSSNDRYDATLLDALGRVKEEWNTPPTPDVRAAVTGEGVCMNFTAIDSPR